MRRDDIGNQLGDANDAKRRHPLQHFTRGMATAFGDERVARFTAQARQVVEFREVNLTLKSRE